MLNQLDICRNDTAIRQYHDSQAEAIQPTEEAVIAKQRGWMLPQLRDINNERTGERLTLCGYSWEQIVDKAFAAKEKGIIGMNSTDRAEACISLIVLAEMLELAFMNRTKQCAIDEATEEANQ
jgi:hypothetical protein